MAADGQTNGDKRVLTSFGGARPKAFTIPSALFRTCILERENGRYFKIAAGAGQLFSEVSFRSNLKKGSRLGEKGVWRPGLSALG